MSRVRQPIPFALALLAATLFTLHASAYNTTDIVDLANANVGKKACSTNSLGGKGFFSSCTGNAGSPEYWCADFARWVWAKRGAEYTSELTAAAGSFYVYGQKHGTLHKTPAIGDAVVFDYKGGGYADHVAIVTKVNANGTIETMSGDWNGQSGTEAEFASTSSVVHNTPAYSGTDGSYSNVTGMTISGYVGPVGVAPLPELDAAFIAQGSDAQKDTSKTADYRVCAGADFHFWFELRNTGAATWTDVNDTAPKHWGKAVRLRTASDKPDVLAGVTEISVDKNANNDVNPAGATCVNKPGCDGTRFTSSGIAATAPDTPGVYSTTWRLVDVGRGSFGPKLSLSFDVVDCGSDAGTSPDAEASGDAGAALDGGAPPDSGTSADAGADAATEASDSVSSDPAGDTGGGISCAVASGAGSGRPGGLGFVLAGIGVAFLIRRRR